MHVGDKIRSLLEQNGFSQADLARGIGKSPFYIHNLLKRNSVDSAVLEMVASFLNVPVTVFFDVIENNTSERMPVLTVQKKCKICHEKDVLIESLKETIASQKKVIRLLEGKENSQ